MKRSISRLHLHSPLILVLVSFALAATLITFAVSASRNANSGPGVSPVNHAQDARATKPLTRIARRNALTSMPLPPVGPTITATLADDITLASKKNPGGTITYTAIISDSGADATGVTYTDTLESNTTLVGSSPSVSPVTVNHSYTATGNVLISVPAVSGVTANDYFGLNPLATITASDTSSTQCPACGNVAVAADGSFTYTPPGNFTGTDTFTYTLSNSTGSSIGTVTITVSDRIMFVSATGAGSTCRPATPCTLTTADGVALIGSGKDLVFVESGTYSSAALSLNSARGAARWEVGSRLSWSRDFGPEQKPTGGTMVKMVRVGGGEGSASPSISMSGTKRFSPELYAQAFNLFNHTNLGSFAGVQQSPQELPTIQCGIFIPVTRLRRPYQKPALVIVAGDLYFRRLYRMSKVEVAASGPSNSRVGNPVRPIGSKKPMSSVAMAAPVLVCALIECTLRTLPAHSEPCV
jgi:uncharacterized repeat protein (TIGR01451 family)